MAGRGRHFGNAGGGIFLWQLVVAFFGHGSWHGGKYRRAYGGAVGIALDFRYFRHIFGFCCDGGIFSLSTAFLQDQRQPAIDPEAAF